MLKTYPGYRLIDNNPHTTHRSRSNSPERTTTQCPNDGLISHDLNPDVTEFLRLLNDVGARIAYFLDTDHTAFLTRDIVTDKTNMDSISSNIIKGVNDLKNFFYELGKKIAPPGVNPYCNNDCMELKKIKHQQKPEKEGCCVQNTNIVCSPEKDDGIEYAKRPS